MNTDRPVNWLSSRIEKSTKSIVCRTRVIYKLPTVVGLLKTTVNYITTTVAQSNKPERSNCSNSLNITSLWKLLTSRPHRQVMCSIESAHMHSAIVLQITSNIIHSRYFYSAPLLLRGAPDTARILRQNFTPKRHRQLWVKNLPKVPMWWLKGSRTHDPLTQPMRHPRPTILGFWLTGFHTNRKRQAINQYTYSYHAAPSSTQHHKY